MTDRSNRKQRREERALKIVIAGDGKVGLTLTQKLVAEGQIVQERQQYLLR